MKTEKIYEYVCKVITVPQDRFFAALNYSVRELVSKYGAFIVTGRDAVTDAVRTDEGVRVRDEFITPLTDNILYLLTGDSNYKTDFTAHAQYAYHTVWRKNNSGKRIRKENW